MPRKAQVAKRKNDAQWHRLKIGDDDDQHYRDCVITILMGIDNDLSVDGLNLRLREAREDVNNAIHEEIDKMPHGISRLHRPSAVKNLYEIFRDQRLTWPVAEREELLLDDQDEDSDEDAEKDYEPVNMPCCEEAVSGNETESGSDMSASQKGVVQQQESAPSTASSSSEEEQEANQDDISETGEDPETFDYQSKYVIYNAQVDIVKAGDRSGDPSWTVSLSHFLSCPELECQQSPDQHWIDIQYVRFSFIEKALKKMKLLDEPDSSIWWSFLARGDLDWRSTKDQVRLKNDWDLGRAVWKSFEGHFENFRGPRREDDKVPRDDHLPRFTLVIWKDAPG